MRRVCFLIHLYVGLTFGLLASVIGLTGSLMVFRPEIEAATNPLLKGARASARTRDTGFSPQAIVETVSAAYPDKTIQTINRPVIEGAPVEIWLAKDPLRIYVDPSTNKIVGARNEEETFFGRLFLLHTEFLAGDRGHTVAGVTGLGMIVLCLTGLVVWWPRKSQKVRDHVRIKLSAGFKRANYDFHRAVGFFACAFLLLIAGTGVALVFPDPTKSLLFRLSGRTERSNKPKVARVGERLPLDQLMARALREMPDGDVRRIVLPAKPTDPVLFRLRRPGEIHPNGMNYLYVDTYSDELLHMDPDTGGHAGQRAMNLRYPLHIGRWAGLASRVLQVFLGLAPALLMISGTLMWWTRTRKTQDRRGTAP